MTHFVLIFGPFQVDINFSVNPTIRGGLLKPPLNKNCIFGTFLWSKWPEKIWLFPNIYDNASHTLLGSQNGLKMGFYSIFKKNFLGYFCPLIKGQKTTFSDPNFWPAIDKNATETNFWFLSPKANLTHLWVCEALS